MIPKLDNSSSFKLTGLFFYFAKHIAPSSLRYFRSRSVNLSNYDSRIIYFMCQEIRVKCCQEL